jgi:hypothetical protein
MAATIESSVSPRTITRIFSLPIGTFTSPYISTRLKVSAEVEMSSSPGCMRPSLAALPVGDTSITKMQPFLAWTKGVVRGGQTDTHRLETRLFQHQPERLAQ